MRKMVRFYRLSETVLWQNPTYTSNFNSKIISWANSIADYDYVKIEFIVSTTHFDDRPHSSIMYSVADFRNDNGGYYRAAHATADSYQGNVYYRLIRYISDTSVQIYDCAYIGNPSQLLNQLLIPYRIYGVK